MKFTHSLAIALSALALPVLAEVVQLQDGRSVELKEDGTYAFVEAEAPSSDAYVEFKESFFTHHVSEYKQKSVRFMPVFKNVGEKRIAGLKFKAVFLNAFGEEIASHEGDIDEQIKPGQTSSANIFYVFKDNQFLGGEMYDKLLPMVTNKSGSINVTATMIALEGNEVIDLSK